MKRLAAIFVLSMALAGSAAAEQRVIVRSSGGESLLSTTCTLLGCDIIRSLGDPAGQLFLVGVADTTDVNAFITSLLAVTGIVDAEVDRLLHIAQSNSPVPAALSDTSTVTYFGATVRSGYVDQDATGIVRLSQAQSQFGVSGSGVVAVIDTGVDPTHPVLSPVLTTGYDFTRNQQGNASELADITQSTAAVIDGVSPAAVSYYASAVLDQSTAAVIDDGHHNGFGHGTMVSGIIHLVAPTATIMPLKAFSVDGSGYVSDILRAVYYAVRNGARVINMSFSMSPSSPEMKNAVDYATGSGVLSVAAAGNDGQSTVVYPAGFSGVVGVASTSDSDVRSSFSNYGSMVWVAAPGEAIISTYPYGTYAAAWGTSFSTPFVSGAAALALQVHGGLSPALTAEALGHAVQLSSDLGHGRLDLVQALQAAQ